jgi:5-methylcytosine-specific restriction protein B
MPKKKGFKFDDYFKKHQKFKEFIFLLGQIIATIDFNGSNKNELNLYEDKRVIAKAGVRQDDWIKNLLKYKLKGKDAVSLSVNSSVISRLYFFVTPLISSQ